MPCMPCRDLKSDQFIAVNCDKQNVTTPLLEVAGGPWSLHLPMYLITPLNRSALMYLL